MAKDHWTTLKLKVISEFPSPSVKRGCDTQTIPKKQLRPNSFKGFQVIASPAFKCAGKCPLYPLFANHPSTPKKKKKTKMAALTKKG